MFCAQPGSAATLLVYNNNDAGAGSLRQAIQDNNALGGGNTIVFSNSVTGVITLGSGLSITAGVTIVGPGANVLKVSGNNSVRVFDITGVTVSISGLTIANGRLSNGDVGAGIQNLGVLTVSNCAFLNNSNTYPNIGGAIYQAGAATLLNCTFQGNSSLGGGAIYAQGQTYVTNCTFTGNSALGNGRGGAIWSATPNGVVLHSCTLFGNSAPQTQSGGGIYADSVSPVYVRNTIIASNTAGSNPDASGIFMSQGYNLIGNAGSTVWNGLGDQVGSPGSPLNPLLAPLQDNGGPTLTMAPLPGSPAIDQGKTSANPSDQRGRPRPYDNPAVPNATGGDGSDIGAVEISPVTLTVSNLNDSGAASLRQAILDASALESDIISFASNVTGRITLTNGELFISKSLTIAGPGASVLAVSGNSSTRVFEILSGNVSLSGLTICDGRVANSVGSFEQDGAVARGGGIFNQANLAIRDCVISNNAVVGGQGGPTDAGIAGNGGNGLGGGILNLSTLALLRCSLVSNSAAGGLGGVATAGGSDGMGGQGFGGGLYTFGAAAITNCVLHGSSALGGAGNAGSGSGSGGAVDNEMSLGLFTCTIANNQSGGSPFDFGGGIYDNGTQLVLRNCTVSGNQADFGGGISSGNADLGNTILAGNTAGSGPDCSGTINSSDYNLIQNTSGCTFTGTTTHNLLGQNPLLGPLTENGGPTKTMALLSGSPAIDKGKSFGFTVDQRGMLRPLDFTSIPNAGGGDGSDIGAFEYWPPSPPLTIQRAGANVLLSWPTNASGFRLQSVTNLLAVNTWSNAGGSPSIIGTQFYLTNPIPAARTFYRLAFP